MDNDDILFYWSMLTASWEESVADKILTMIVDLWITIRGFSLASAWVEEFKAHNKKTLQKSKGLRKHATVIIMLCFVGYLLYSCIFSIWLSYCHMYGFVLRIGRVN